MARHVAKITLLLVSGLITACLLSFMLISDHWIEINTQKLTEIEAKFEENYQVYTGQRLAKPLDIKTATEPAVKLNKQLVKATTATTTTSTTTQSMRVVITTTTTTTTTTLNKLDELDHSDLNEHEEEQTDENDTSNDDSESLDYEPEENNNAKRQKRSDDQIIDYVYLTRLWPLVKYKSLYSECVEYRKIHLKISSAFLNQPNKEPLLGTIHYGRLMSKINNSSKLNCDTQPGMIKCLLTQECVQGRLCDGITDCDDQSDEQLCDENTKCYAQTGGIPIKCDNRCWQYWQKCDQMPNCLDLSDELSPECSSQKSYSFIDSISSMMNTNFSVTLKSQLTPFTFGRFHYDKKRNCFVNYFDFKSARTLTKENIKSLSPQLADHIQDKNNLSYNLQVIYSLAFVSALAFTLLALLSLSGVSCFKKLCFHCPFWFYGFFTILAWITCFFGLMAFMFQCFSTKFKSIEPYSRLPIDNELIRLNPELIGLQEFGITFWIAVAATSFSFLTSFVSCLVCCNLPTVRHEDKEYQIMQLPTYS